MDLTKLNNSLYHVELPPETIGGWQEKMDAEFSRYGKMFKNREECDYFSMLPLNEEQRMAILDVMMEESKFAKELRYCSGEANKSRDHRSRCIHCVLKFPPNRNEKVCL